MDPGSGSGMTQMQIIPAILEKNFVDVSTRLEQVVGSAKTVQIDVCDGVFVPSVSWPYTAPMTAGGPNHYDHDFKDIVGGEGEVNMPHWEDLDFELDLMVADPKRLLPHLLTIGPSRVIFHAEALKDLESDMYELAKMIPPIVEIGIAIHLNTNPEILFNLIDEKIISSVQCMGIASIGSQGQPQDERVYANLHTLRSKYPDLPLSVDGAVTLENALKLKEAGASRLVVGSALFSAENPASQIAAFKKVVQ